MKHKLMSFCFKKKCKCGDFEIEKVSTPPKLLCPKNSKLEGMSSYENYAGIGICSYISLELFVRKSQMHKI